jgi:DNA-directed RNA polymerase
MFTIQDQIEMELSSFTKGVGRYRRQVDKMVSKGLDSRTLHGRAIIKSIIEPLASGVREIQNPEDNRSKRRDVAYSKLKNMDADVIAYITLITVIDTFSQHSKLIKVARNIGANVELEKRIQEWEEEDKEVARNVLKLALKKSSGHSRRMGLTHKLNKDLPDSSWSEEEKIHVGVRLVDKLIVHTGMVSIDKISIGKLKTASYLKVSQSTLDWISKFNSLKEKARPVSCPCIIPPKDWTDVVGGGYYNEVMPKLVLVRNN